MVGEGGVRRGSRGREGGGRGWWDININANSAST